MSVMQYQLGEAAALFAAYLEETIQGLEPIPGRFWRDLDQLLPASGAPVLKSDISHEMNVRFNWKNNEQRADLFQYMEEKFLTGYAVPAHFNGDARSSGKIYRLSPGKIYPPPPSSRNEIPLKRVSDDPMTMIDKMRKKKGENFFAGGGGSGGELFPLQEKFLKELVQFIPPSSTANISRGVAAQGGKFVDEVMNHMLRSWKPGIFNALLTELSMKGMIRQTVVDPSVQGDRGKKVFILRDALPKNVLSAVVGENNSNNNSKPQQQQQQQQSHHGYNNLPKIEQLEQCKPTPQIYDLVTRLVLSSSKVQKDNLTPKEKMLLESFIFLMCCAREDATPDPKYPVSSLKINRSDALKAVENIYLENLVRGNPRITPSERDDLLTNLDGEPRAKAIAIMRSIFNHLLEKKYFWSTSPSGATMADSDRFVKVNGEFGKSMNTQLQFDLLTATGSMLAINKLTAEDEAKKREMRFAAASAAASVSATNNNNNNNNSRSQSSSVMTNNNLSRPNHQHQQGPSSISAAPSPLPRTIGTRRSRSSENSSNHHQQQQQQHQHQQYQQQQQQQQQQYHFDAPPPPPPPPQQQQQQPQKLQGPPGSQILFDSNGIPTMMILADGTVTKLNAAPPPAPVQQQSSQREVFVVVQRDPKESILYPPPIYIFMGEPLTRPASSRLLISPPPMFIKKL